jgi:GDP-4-dehydro-6-deoxy-D-mannose reductase
VPTLVTGAAGFVGARLLASLAADGADVVGTARTPRGSLEPMDVRDQAAVEAVVRRVRPERLYHLAAQSSAARSWREPLLTYETNVAGTHYLLDAVRQQVPACRVLLACTSDSYGRAEPGARPLDEDAPLRPMSPYAASKVAQESVGRMFAESYGTHVVMTRAFMHIGPGQPASFATADWARQIALAEAGLGPREVVVGDLSLRRELGDVRDVVRAYRAVLEQGRPGEVYNVATGEAPTLGEALGVLLSSARVAVAARRDPARIRPADPPVLVGSAAKLRSLTGWTPRHRLEDTLAEVLDHWRAEVASEQVLGAPR